MSPAMSAEHKGKLEVIAGCMFAGKSEELIRRMKRATIARQGVQGYKPVIDNRYSANQINSHNGHSHDCKPIEQAVDIFKDIKKDTRVVGIDESQFFDEDIVPVVEQLIYEDRKRVIVAGLDNDFRGEPFGYMPRLLTLAQEVTKLKAVCMVCGDEDADRTQRIIDGVPAHYEDPVIKVGAQEAYEARCIVHHEVPGRPEKIIVYDSSKALKSK